MKNTAIVELDIFCKNSCHLQTDLEILMIVLNFMKVGIYLLFSSKNYYFPSKQTLHPTSKDAFYTRLSKSVVLLGIH